MKRKNIIENILIISFIVIALAGISALGIIWPSISSLYGQSQSIQTENQPIVNSNTSDTEIEEENSNNLSTDSDKVQDESLNGQDDSQEVKGAEDDGEIESSEPVIEQEQDENLPDGEHQDQDNLDVDHQFERVE